MSEEVAKTPRERAMRLVGRVDALTEVAAAVSRFGDGSTTWKAFLSWMNDQLDDVLEELALVKAESQDGD